MFDSDYISEKNYISVKNVWQNGSKATTADCNV